MEKLAKFKEMIDFNSREFLSALRDKAHESATEPNTNEVWASHFALLAVSADSLDGCLARSTLHVDPQS